MLHTKISAGLWGLCLKSESELSMKRGKKMDARGETRTRYLEQVE